MVRSFIILFCCALVFSACDKITNPIQEGGIGPIDSTIVTRKILLEDLTGHFCNNCPRAALVADQIKDIYGDQVIVVGIHAGPITFTEPQSNPDNSYATDFRTPAGNTYAQTFNVNTLPSGMVSRTEFNGTRTLGDASWISAVSEIVGQNAILKITFDSLFYEGSTDQLSTKIKIEALTEINGEYKCIIYLLEDGLIDWQLNSNADPPDVPNYEHGHVLRDNLTGTWGTTIFSGNVEEGTIANVLVNGFSLNPIWNMNNGYLVAYVYNELTNEVWQVEEIKIVP